MEEQQVRKKAPLAINLVKLERQVVPRARSQEEPRPAASSGQQRSVVKAILVDSSRDKESQPASHAERRPEGEDPPGWDHRSEEDALCEVANEGPGSFASMSPCGGSTIHTVP